MLSIIGEHDVLVSFLAAPVRGWFMAAMGKSEDGIAEMRRTVENAMFADALVNPLMLVVLAEMCGINGRAE